MASIIITALDKYDNLMVNYTDKSVSLTMSSYPAGADVIPVMYNRTNSGVTEFRVTFNLPGVYRMKLSCQGIPEKELVMKVLLKKDKENVLYSGTEYGSTKLVIPANVLSDDLIIELTKPGNTAQHVSKTNSIINMADLVLLEKTRIKLTAKDVNGTEQQTLNLPSYKHLVLTLPYPDKDKTPGIVDDTTINEKHLRVWRYDAQSAKWLVQNMPVLNTELNNITINIRDIGEYGIMSIPTDPKIESTVVYPNPFTDKTKIAFNLNAPAELKIRIYSVSGRLVRTMTRGYDENLFGLTTIEFDGLNDKNEKISNGTYIYKINTMSVSGIKQEQIGKFTKIE
jgi:hypothetical protein